MRARTDLMLRPGTAILRLGPHEVQVGTDPRWAVRLTGLEPADADWLVGLEPGGPLRGAVDHEAANRALVEANYVVNRVVRPRGPITAPAAGAADLCVLSALRPDGAGRRTLEVRARSVVAVAGLGRLGTAIASTLATAGVGRLVLDDPRRVLVSDVGLGGHQLRDVSEPREAAARRAVAESAPGVRVTAGIRPDVVVTVDHRVADPVRLHPLMGEGIPHLSVVVREADVVVGPFVRPGTSPCVRCVELARADEDPHWPELARLLLVSGGPEFEETSLTAAAAAIATGQVLAALDGATPRAAGACLEICAPDVVPRVRKIAVHPRCGCGDLSTTLPDGFPSGAEATSGPEPG